MTDSESEGNSTPSSGSASGGGLSPSVESVYASSFMDIDEQFKARRFDTIVKMFGELTKKESHLKEYGIEIKFEEKMNCFAQIRQEVTKPESRSENMSVFISMSVKEQFKVRQFEAIAKLIDEFAKKESFLKEYGVEIKTEEKMNCLLQIKKEIEC